MKELGVIIFTGVWDMMISGACEGMTCLAHVNEVKSHDVLEFPHFKGTVCNCVLDN